MADDEEFADISQPEIQDTPPSLQELAEDLRRQSDEVIDWLASGVSSIEDVQDLTSAFNELTESIARVPDALVRETLLCRLEAQVMAEQLKDRDGLNVSVMSNVFSKTNECRIAVTDRALNATRSEVHRLASAPAELGGWETLIGQIMEACALGERLRHLQLVSSGLTWMASRGIDITGLEALFNRAHVSVFASDATYRTCEDLLQMKSFDPERHSEKVIADCARLFNSANKCHEPDRQNMKNQTYLALMRVAESTKLDALREFLLGVSVQPKPAEPHGTGPESIDDHKRRVFGFLTSGFSPIREAVEAVETDIGKLIAKIDKLDAPRRMSELQKLKDELQPWRSILSLPLFLVTARLDKLSEKQLEEEPADASSADSHWVSRPRSHYDVHYPLRPDILMARFDERLKIFASSLRVAVTSLGTDDVARRFQAVNDTILAAQPDRRPAMYDALNFEINAFVQEHPGAWQQALPQVPIPRGVQPDSADAKLFKAIDVLLDQFGNLRASDYRPATIPMDKDLNDRTQDERCEQLVTAIHKIGGAAKAQLLAKLGRGLNVLRLNHNDPEMGLAMKRMLDRWFDPGYKNWTFVPLQPQ
jgi:hypothetical protein